MLAVILDHGMRQMMERQIGEFYYITVMNENYAQPSIAPGLSDEIVKGMYLLAVRGNVAAKLKVQLLGSGTILREAIAAADLCIKISISPVTFSVSRASASWPETRAMLSVTIACTPSSLPGPATSRRVSTGARPSSLRRIMFELTPN
jgi:pyruvate dehydrogenase E1 component